MITIRHTWLGLVILLLVLSLIAVSVLYWHHVTGASYTHLLGMVHIPLPSKSEGC
jgi:hypothetical protein